jgi:cysteine synthase
MLTELLKGQERKGSVVNLAAALVANAAAVYQVSNFNQQLGTKSFKALRIVVQNVAAGNCWVSLGTGTGGTFAATVPVFRSLNNITETFELYGVEHFADMTSWVDALAAGGSLNLQAVVEEIG